MQKYRRTPKISPLTRKLAILVLWAFQWGITPLSPPILPPFRLKFAKQISSAKRAWYAISKTPPFFTLAQKLPNLRPVLDFLWRAEEIMTMSFVLNLTL